MAAVRASLWVLGTWLGLCACARADERVVLVQQRGLRDGLCAALRIQLTGTAEVECQPDRAEGSLDQRIAHTAQSVVARSARLGVLLEHDPDPKRLRMYLVSSVPDRALIAIESIEDRPAPDVDRSLALKVLDAYEQLSVAQAAVAAQAPLAAALVTRAASTEPPPAQDWQALLEAGGGASIGTRLRASGSVIVGMARVTDHTRAELALGARLSSRLRQRDEPGQVSVAQRGGVASLRFLWRQGRFMVGGALDVMAALLSAEGITSRGKRGEQRKWLPSLGLALDLRFQLFRSAFLRFAPGVELATIDRRWAVSERVVLEQGVATVQLPLSLLVSLPLSRREERHIP